MPTIPRAWTWHWWGWTPSSTVPDRSSTRRCWWPKRPCGRRCPTLTSRPNSPRRRRSSRISMRAPAQRAMGDWPDADSIEIATALEGWRPTAGTLMTGTRNVEPHRELRAVRLTPNDPSRVTAWDFPPPFGRAELVPLSLGETVLLSQHLKVPEIRAGINSRSLEDLADPDLPRRTAGQDRTPVQQAFVIDVAVTRGPAPSTPSPGRVAGMQGWWSWRAKWTGHAEAGRRWCWSSRRGRPQGDQRRARPCRRR